jgi:hypothetical protein
MYFYIFKLYGNINKMSRPSISSRILGPVEPPIDCGSIPGEADCNARNECSYDPRDKCIPKTIAQLLAIMQLVQDQVTRGERPESSGKSIITKLSNSIPYEQYFLSSTRAWRDDAIRFIKIKAEGKEDPCEFSTWMTNVSVLTAGQKKSTSGTIIMKGLFNPTREDIIRNTNSNIVFKISYPSKDPFANSLDVEKAIYKTAIMALVNNRHTPGLIAYLGEIKCPSTIPNMSSQLKVDYQEALDTIDPEDYDTLEQPTILALEMSKGVKLIDWLNNTRTLKEMLGVVFILIYTLSCFSMILLRHNDLHFENIFVEDIGREITLYFQIKPDEVVGVVTRYIPKIYDFDRGYMINPAIPDNLLLDAQMQDRDGNYFSLCNKYGTCNDSFVIIYDLFSLLLNFCLYMELKNVEDKVRGAINYFVFECVNKTWLLYTLRKHENDMPHLLRRDNIPEQVTDVSGDEEVSPGVPKGKMVNPMVALKTLYRKNWGAHTPFVINPGFIQRDMMFTLPNPGALQFVNEYPVNKIPTLAQDISFFKSLEGQTIDNENHKFFFGVWVKKLWAEQIFEYIGVNIKENALKLAEIVKRNMLNGAVIPDVFLYYACVNLCCYQFHRLTQETLLTAYDQRGIAVINHIWNMFGNRLPVEIPVPYLMPV